MDKTIVFCGYTSSGKTTLVNKLCEKYGYNKLITYTSRPPREGEEDGIDYHFRSISKMIDRFLSEDPNYRFGELTWYETAYGKWLYGSCEKDYKENTIAVLNADGIKQLRRKGIPVLTVFVKAQDEEIIGRLIGRGDSEREYTRRLKSDKLDFDHLESTFDIVLDTTGKTIEESISELVNNPKWNE